ncbi:hypothetical protein HK105_201827 [Polyrhizophydium stewartii]|uniref:Uncharacterized protein n=1 Tax=Polyrhizophydium stewartii TaxID=2732419 RepID=A0ABR4NFX3_9FUNG
MFPDRRGTGFPQASSPPTSTSRPKDRAAAANREAFTKHAATSHDASNNLKPAATTRPAAFACPLAARVADSRTTPASPASHASPAKPASSAKPRDLDTATALLFLKRLGWTRVNPANAVELACSEAARLEILLEMIPACVVRDKKTLTPTPAPPTMTPTNAMPPAKPAAKSTARLSPLKELIMSVKQKTAQAHNAPAPAASPATASLATASPAAADAPLATTADVATVAAAPPATAYTATVATESTATAPPAVVAAEVPATVLPAIAAAEATATVPPTTAPPDPAEVIKAVTNSATTEPTKHCKSPYGVSKKTKSKSTIQIYTAVHQHLRKVSVRVIRARRAAMEVDELGLVDMPVDLPCRPASPPSPMMVDPPAPEPVPSYSIKLKLKEPKESKEPAAKAAAPPKRPAAAAASKPPTAKKVVDIRDDDLFGATVKKQSNGGMLFSKALQEFEVFAGMPKAKLERFNPIPPVLPGTTTAGKPGQAAPEAGASAGVARTTTRKPGSSTKQPDARDAASAAAPAAARVHTGKTPYSKLSLEEKTVSMRQESTPSRESESWADDKHDASEPSMQQLKMQRRETQG